MGDLRVRDRRPTSVTRICGVFTRPARSIIMIVFGFLLIFIPPCVIKDYHLGSGLRGN